MNSLRRSLLFVPGHEEKRINKALGLNPDTIIFDLEDAVPLAEKESARARVAETVRANPDKDLLVRVNSFSCEYFEDDINAAIESKATGVMVPKTGSLKELQAYLKTIAKICLEKNTDIEVFALIESALGIANLKDIAMFEDQNLKSICFGHADFSLDLGLPDNSSDHGAVLAARSQVPVMAKAFGKLPIDTVCLEFKDEEKIKADILLGQQLGFEGKLCIHPLQAQLCNQLYTPTEEQIQFAHDLLDAWAQAQAQGLAVMSYRNKMVDAPVVLQQQKILERAKIAGLIT